MNSRCTWPFVPLVLLFIWSGFLTVSFFYLHSKLPYDSSAESSRVDVDPYQGFHAECVEWRNITRREDSFPHHAYDLEWGACMHECSMNEGCAVWTNGSVSLGRCPSNCDTLCREIAGGRMIEHYPPYFWNETVCVKEQLVREVSS